MPVTLVVKNGVKTLSGSTGMPQPVIGHFEYGLCVGRRHREFHCLGIRFLAGLHRVFEKIEQNLLDHHGVAHKFVTGTQDANLDFHAEALGLNQGKFHGGRNDFVDRYGRDVGFTPFGFAKLRMRRMM